MSASHQAENPARATDPAYQCPPQPKRHPPPPRTRPDDQQEYQRPDCGVDDRRNHPHAEVNTELRKQPAADEGADNSNDEIADDPKSGALHELQPPGNEANHQYDQETFA
jgi:hypothetical protein